MLELFKRKETVDISPVEIAECLSSERRVLLIKLIDELGETTKNCISDEMVERLEGIEHEATGENGHYSKVRKRYQVGNHQTHLPRLDDWGVIDYDPDRGTVAPGPNLDGLLGAIDDLNDRSDTSM